MKTNTVSYVLKLESAAILAACIYLYRGNSWTLFFTLFLLPDIAMLGYLVGNKVGAWCYNVAHSYVTAAVCAIAMPSPLWLIWFAHIAFDRALGYGLKLEQGFNFTHLGRIGQEAKNKGTGRANLPLLRTAE